MPYFLDQGEFLEGEKEYKSAIRIATLPKAVYYGNLGVLYHRCLKFQLGFFRIDKICSLWRDVSCTRWGDTKKAVSSYKAALKINPSLRSARENLAKLLA